MGDFFCFYLKKILTFALMNSIVEKIKDEIAPENLYPYVQADLNEWAIVRLARDRDQAVKDTVAAATQKIKTMVGDRLGEEIALVIYQEGIRRRTDPWKIDLPDEDSFWKRTRRDLTRKTFNHRIEEEASDHNSDKILTAIVERYADEIAGDFHIPTFEFTRRFLTQMFNRLLNAAASPSSFKFWGTHHRLQDRIKFFGEIEHLRALATKGTVVLVPTHFSNLDSTLIGWAIDALGLPAFSYGAGLNLFNFDIVAFFMNRLGAYKVDRRKKNLIYLETLKTFSQLTIERGVHSLFFPGGTRERSGALESRLKLGLLGTALEAQEAHFIKGKEEKIFIVPLVLGYHFVLEAEGLIEEHLRRTGKEMYLTDKDERPTIWKTIKFIWKFFADSAEINLNFGKPMDVFGNFVDEDGKSIDKFGKEIDIRDYFVSDGELKADTQRDEQYTKLLADKIVERFHKENIVLSSHVVAYVAFNTLKAKYPNVDLYGILRLREDETQLEYKDYLRNIVSLQKVLFEYQRDGKLKLSPEIGLEAETLVQDGIKNLGVFHPSKPFLQTSDEAHFYTQNQKLLFYYHNKLAGYGLEKKIEW
jgi:glycerol-3-phosphate O-acyltransferase